MIGNSGFINGSRWGGGSGLWMGWEGGHVRGWVAWPLQVTILGRQ